MTSLPIVSGNTIPAKIGWFKPKQKEQVMNEKGLLKDVFATIETSLARLTEKVRAAKNSAVLEDLTLTTAGLAGADEIASNISRLCQTLTYLQRHIDR